MKRNQLQEIKTLDIVALLKKADELRGQIATQVMDKHMNKLTDLKVTFKTKKDLAQVLTIVKQKQLIATLEAKSDKTVEPTEETKKTDDQKISPKSKKGAKSGSK